MGESACLVRSFSQPAAISSRETNEAIPRRVLTESISFGRFASESLQWEKWSAFTQNRYLEEVERFTKPGSVAQKRAFFEAHFKNRAAGRTTKTKIQEINVKTSDESVCEIRKDNLINSEVPFVVNNGMAMNEVTHEDVSNAEVDSVVPLISVMDKTTGQDKVLDVENLNLNSMAVPEEEALDEEISTSLSKERRSSSKLEPSVIRRDTSRKPRKESPSNSKWSISVSKNQNRSLPQPFHMSINCAPSSTTDKKVVEIPQNGSRSSTNGYGAEEAVKKKKRSVSLNCASSGHQAIKTATKNLARNSTKLETTSSNARSKVFSNENEPTGASKSRKRPLSRTVEEDFKAAKCSTSASTVRLPKFPPPNNLPSEDKRKIITGSSVSCRIPQNVKRLPSVCENLSTQSRARAKSFTVSSPFNFRSDERAEKRKEFFKKLDVKSKKVDIVKEQLSCAFKTNQKTHLASEKHKNPQVGSFQAPLISLASPKFRRNRIPVTEKIKNSNQTPHKASSVKTTNIRNASIEKHKRCKIHPSQTKKKTQENSSPNILQN